jgi:hypothetical protein
MQEHEVRVGRIVSLIVKLDSVPFEMLGVIDTVLRDSVVIRWHDGRRGRLYWNRAQKANAYNLTFVAEGRLRGENRIILPN